MVSTVEWVLIIIGVITLGGVYTMFVGMLAWAWDKRFNAVPIRNVITGKLMYIDPKFDKPSRVNGKKVVLQKKGPAGLFSKEEVIDGDIFWADEKKTYGMYPEAELLRRVGVTANDLRKMLWKAEGKARATEIKAHQIEARSERMQNQRNKEVIKLLYENGPFYNKPQQKQGAKKYG